MKSIQWWRTTPWADSRNRRWWPEQKSSGDRTCGFYGLPSGHLNGFNDIRRVAQAADGDQNITRIAASAFYLKLLSGLTQSFSTKEARDALLKAKTQEELWKILVKATKKRFSSRAKDSPLMTHKRGDFRQGRGR